MGRMRKRYNEKARSNSNTQERDSKRLDQNVVVEFNVPEEKYDSSNAFILSGKKDKNEKSKKREHVPPKPLSKKKRKLLQKVLDKKKRSVNRSELLEKLSHVQATPHELQFLTSLSEMQTKGLKRSCDETISSKQRGKISNIKGMEKSDLPAKKAKFDPNVVTLDSESSSDSEEEDLPSNEHTEEVVETDVVESHNIQDIPEKKENSEPQKTDAHSNINDKPKEIVETKEVDRTPAVFVTVNRKPEIQDARSLLPIFCEEQSLIEAVKENLVVIIHGETGSGKTTQMPQFLYEAGFTKNGKLIGVTEPRRIAAMTMSARVGEELNDIDLVSYHIRYEKTVTAKTEIKFMTDGVLLKEIRNDFFLTRYSVIIIDEAHERSIFSDVLIGLLSRIVPLREKKGDPLRLIIMSATIRVEDFMENSRLFKIKPHLIRIASRQHKVQVHFNIRTSENYVEAAFQKVCKIHTQLPPGTILVFLTGEKEIKDLCKMLHKAFPSSNSTKESSTLTLHPQQTERKNRTKKHDKNEEESFCSLPPQINLDDYAVEPLDTELLEHQLQDEEEESFSGNFRWDKSDFATPMHILPLYAVLPFEEQEKVFKPPPPGSRLCVIATNVAETSITIPGLKYVVDSGKVKIKLYDKHSGGISRFVVTWCSKASANQRAGRCGRTEGGHCYRLYSSAVFENDLPDYYPPEIQRIPVDDILLQMKALGIDRVVNFPFPSSPDNEGLKTAERRLILLGALQDIQKGQKFKDINKWEFSSKVTQLGKAMSRFPLSPRFAKMLILSYKHKCVPWVIAIVSGFTVSQLFVTSSSSDSTDTEGQKEKELWKGIKKLGNGKALQLGDIMVLLKAIAVFIESNMSIKFCAKMGIRHKAMVEIYKMSHQLLREMNQAFTDSSLPLSLEFEPPNEDQIEVLRKIIAAGFTDHVARRIPIESSKEDKSLKNAYKCLDLEEPVFIHPSSILFDQLPEFVVYQEIIHTTKFYMKGVVEVDSEWLPGFAPTLCDFSYPLEDPPPTYDAQKDIILCTMPVTFGRWQWEIPQVCTEMPQGLQKYSWFSFFLLDGQVIPFFKTYCPELLSRPTVMTKSWAKLLPRSRYMLQALISKQVDSKKSLEKAWEENSQFLLQEFCHWLPHEQHLELELKWPPV